MARLGLLIAWVHVVAACAWIGSMIFLTLAVVPALRAPEVRPLAPTIFRRLGRRLRWIGWISMGLLVATGVANLGVWGFGWEDVATGRLWEGTFGVTLAIKLSLVAVIVVLNVAHDFWFGPAAMRAAAAAPGSPEALHGRRVASWAGRLTLLLSLAVVAFALVLRRGLP